MRRTSRERRPARTADHMLTTLAREEQVALEAALRASLEEQKRCKQPQRQAGSRTSQLPKRITQPEPVVVPNKRVKKSPSKKTPTTTKPKAPEPVLHVKDEQGSQALDVDAHMSPAPVLEAETATQPQSLPAARQPQQQPQQWTVQEEHRSDSRNNGMKRRRGSDPELAQSANTQVEPVIVQKVSQTADSLLHTVATWAAPNREQSSKTMLAAMLQLGGRKRDHRPRLGRPASRKSKKPSSPGTDRSFEDRDAPFVTSMLQRDGLVQPRPLATQQWDVASHHSSCPSTPIRRDSGSTSVKGDADCGGTPGSPAVRPGVDLGGSSGPMDTNHDPEQQCSGGIGRTKDKRRRLSQPQSVFNLPQAPVYHPTSRQFTNPLEYIASIRQTAERYGICRIVPPPEWNPSCVLDEQKLGVFDTRLQRLHQLFKRDGEATRFLQLLRAHLEQEGNVLVGMPMLGSTELDLCHLSRLVRQHGGLQSIIEGSNWSLIANELGIPRSCSNREERLQGMYYKYLLSFDLLSPDERTALEESVNKRQTTSKPAQPFGYGTGKSHTLRSFKKVADDAKAAWFKQARLKGQGDPADLEREYWNILEQRNRHVSVCYGSDIDTTRQGSGFATDDSDPYSKFGWNLNVLPGLPESILKNVEGISGISMPWMYIGMMFSSFSWHTEDNYLYSINYHHFGAPKTWYGVPSTDAVRFERSFRKHLPEEFATRPGLLHDMVTQLSPAKLVADGVRVVTTLQEAGEFVVTFPQSYHAGFSHGFNCGEAVNFAASDWLPYGLRAMNKYRKEKRQVSLVHHQVLYETATKDTHAKTLWHVMPQLQRLHDEEVSMKQKLQQRGLCLELSPERFAELVQKAGQLKHGQGRHFEAASPPSQEEAEEAEADVSQESLSPRNRMSSTMASDGMTRMMGGRSSFSSLPCDRCCAETFFSLLLVVTDEGKLAMRYGMLGSEHIKQLLCLPCIVENATESVDNFVLVSRHPPEELAKLIARIEPIIAHLPEYSDTYIGPTLQEENQLFEFDRAVAAARQSGNEPAAPVAGDPKQEPDEQLQPQPPLDQLQQQLKQEPTANSDSVGRPKTTYAGSCRLARFEVATEGMMLTPEYARERTEQVYKLRVPKVALAVELRLVSEDNDAKLEFVGHHQASEQPLQSDVPYRVRLDAAHAPISLKFRVTSSDGERHQVYTVQFLYS